MCATRAHLLTALNIAYEWRGLLEVVGSLCYICIKATLELKVGRLIPVKTS